MAVATRAAALLLTLSCGCGGGDGSTLLVDLVTDHGVTDFERVETTVRLFGGSDGGVEALRRVSTVLDASRAEALATGVRVAEVGGLAAGTHVVTVRLLVGDAEVARRSVRVPLPRGASVATTVVITQSCRGVECPGPADDPSQTECHGGRCVSPACTDEGPVGCGGCTSDEDCASAVPCVVGTCASGACLSVPDDARCTDDRGGRCDPIEGCRYSGCEVGSCDDGDPCTADECTEGGCASTPLDDTPCDDGVFCNGTDRCVAGACADHAGDPCGASTRCDEATMSCGACDADADCPAAIESPFGACDWSSACDESAERRRTIMRFTCTGRVCVGRVDTETEGCARSTGGDTCGPTESGPWSDCSYTDVCDETATRERTVTRSTCGGGVCRTTSPLESEPCTRDTDTTTCGPPELGEWTSCDYEDTCDQEGSRERTLTSYACAAGACAPTVDVERDECTRSTDGASCGRGRTCLDATCCTGLCGDASQDGTVSALDASIALRFADGLEVPTACALEAADVIRNSGVSSGDAQLILSGAVGIVDLTTGCASSCGLCGDANQNGAVSVADAIRILNLRDDPAPNPVCEHWAGDVDGDGDLDDEDAMRLQRFLVGTDTLDCAPK